MKIPPHLLPDVILSKKAPQPIGPYSQAMNYGDFIFCSGQIGTDPQTGELALGIENQLKQIMENIQEILHEAHSDLDHVVKATIFLTDLSEYAKVNAIYSTYFPNQKPPRSAVEVRRLPKDAQIEIEVVAVVKK